MAGYDSALNLALVNQKNIQDVKDKIHTELNLSFPFDEIILDAEAGDFPTHEPLGWTRSHLTIALTTYKNLPAFVIPDLGGNYSIEKLLTLQDFNNLHRYGGTFGATLALHKTNGSEGVWLIMTVSVAGDITEIDEITTPFAGDNQRRLSNRFIHTGVGSFVKLSATVDGTPEIIFDGTTQELNVTDWEGNLIQYVEVPKIIAGDLFNSSFHVRDGLDGTMFLYVNGVLIFNPVFAITNYPNVDRVECTGGSNSGNRVSYVRNFGSTINTGSDTITLTKPQIEAYNHVRAVTTKGTRNLSFVIPKNLELPTGYTYQILSQNIGLISWYPESAPGLAGTIDGLATGQTEVKGVQKIIKTNTLENGAKFVDVIDDSLLIFESLRTGMIAYAGMSLHATPLTVTFGVRSMRFVDKITGYSILITRPAVDFLFTEGLNAPDDLGVVHFYEDIDGNIEGSAKTDWSTPVQRRRYVYLGNADVNLAKDGFLQANNPLVSAFGLLDTFGDYLAIGGSIKGKGGEVTLYGFGNGISIAGYTAVAWGRNFDNSELPHTPTSGDLVNADLHLGYRTSEISMLFGDTVNAIDPTQYQRIEDTILSVVPDGKYTIQRVYQFPGTDYNMVVYGSTLYDNLEQAINNASTERYNLHPSLVPACFLAYLVVPNDMSNFDAFVSSGLAAILNYDGTGHPQTIGAEASPALSLKAGGKLRSLVDQYALIYTAPPVFIDFEVGQDSLYGCVYNAVNRTLKNTSQQDMLINIVPQIGRRETGTSVGLEIFIDTSFNGGLTWVTSGNDSYAVYKNIIGQTDVLSVGVLMFRVIPNAMIRIGMVLKTAQNSVGILSNGEGLLNPGSSISGRQLPSCELTIT